MVEIGPGQSQYTAVPMDPSKQRSWRVGCRSRHLIDVGNSMTRCLRRVQREHTWYWRWRAPFD
eukprot:COSAG02_NODE_56257_length_286_cov_0.946524_1_plen_62_part_10